MPESSATQQAASACLDASETALKSSSLWDVHDRLSVAAETEAGETEQDPVYEQEPDTYLKEPRFISRSTDIFGCWHCSQFPSLEPAAEKYVFVCSTD